MNLKDFVEFHDSKPVDPGTPYVVESFQLIEQAEALIKELKGKMVQDMIARGDDEACSECGGYQVNLVRKQYHSWDQEILEELLNSGEHRKAVALGYLKKPKLEVKSNRVGKLLREGESPDQTIHALVKNQIISAHKGVFIGEPRPEIRRTNKDEQA